MKPVLRHGVIAVTLLVFGCERSVEESKMTQAEFEALLAASAEHLRLVTTAHANMWGLGTFDEWALDQEQGDLVLSSADGGTAIAPAQVIGSFNASDNSWMWAWANPSIEEELAKDSVQLKLFGMEHGIETLTTPKWVGTEEEAWAMTALAVKLCDAQGAYRGPAGGSAFIFMTFGEVNISKGKRSP